MERGRVRARYNAVVAKRFVHRHRAGWSEEGFARGTTPVVAKRFVHRHRAGWSEERFARYNAGSGQTLRPPAQGRVERGTVRTRYNAGSGQTLRPPAQGRVERGTVRTRYNAGSGQTLRPPAQGRVERGTVRTRYNAGSGQRFVHRHRAGWSEERFARALGRADVLADAELAVANVAHDPIDGVHVKRPDFARGGGRCGRLPGNRRRKEGRVVRGEDRVGRGLITWARFGGEACQERLGLLRRVGRPRVRGARRQVPCPALPSISRRWSSGCSRCSAASGDHSPRTGRDGPLAHHGLRTAQPK